MKVTVIGLGEIGYEIYKALKKRCLHDIHGVEVSEVRLIELCASMPQRQISNQMNADSDIYILAVYTPKQIKEVLSKIDLTKNPLIIIESTMLPGETDIILKAYPNIDLVLFPHRYNPNDKEHHVFNLNRIIGANTGDALARALQFYKPYMDINLIHPVSLKVAELAKPLENAYRYIEIAIAEEVKMMCKEKGINFDELRSAINTKWNIDMKEARQGIGLKCLPKDIGFINEYYTKNNLFNSAMRVDALYRAFLHKQEIILGDE
ncbi:MAG: hypothetical protein M0R03_23850 [Novosphingobium sp.]|nr:hypothetical protein [Novosphingobium sp.]